LRLGEFVWRGGEGTGGAVVEDEGAADALAGGVAVAFMCGMLSPVGTTAESLAVGWGGALMWS
jgi:di/tricarboxylate transporter